MVSVEATIVATAIPTIVGALGGLRLFSWVFGIYVLTQAVGIPIYGRLADLYGRKTVMLVAVLLFLAGSILSGFAHSMVMLIVYRGLQGLGGGGVQPLAYTIVGDLYSGNERARVQGYLSSTWGISAVAGPLLGAFVLQHVGWPAIFWINVPFGILCVWLVLRFFHEPIERRSHRIDYAGSALLAAGAGALMFALVMAGTLAIAPMVALGVVAVTLLVAFVAHELRTPEPMMPLRLLRVRAIGIANAANFAIGAMAMGVTAFVPTYVQGAMGRSAIAAGAMLGVMSFTWTAGALIASRALARLTFRATAVAGGIVVVAGSAFLVLLLPTSGMWLPAAGTALMGLGFGLVNVVLMIATQAQVGSDQRGAATASILFMRQFGQAIGSTAFGAVFNLGLSATPGAATIADSLHGIYAIMAGLGLVVLLLTFALPSKVRADDVRSS